jgi:hypothetical protein
MNHGEIVHKQNSSASLAEKVCRLLLLIIFIYCFLRTMLFVLFLFSPFVPLTYYGFKGKKGNVIPLQARCGPECG